jgi:hypothetical protein
MSTEAEKLRAQAARLYALAIDARDKGDAEIAEAFTAGAAHYLEMATDVERKAGTAPLFVPREAERVVQQQQQHQPKAEE